MRSPLSTYSGAAIDVSAENRRKRAVLKDGEKEGPVVRIQGSTVFSLPPFVKLDWQWHFCGRCAFLACSSLEPNLSKITITLASVRHGDEFLSPLYLATALPWSASMLHSTRLNQNVMSVVDKRNKVPPPPPLLRP